MEERRILLGLSARTLAEKIETPTKKFSYTAVWGWIYSPEGSPPAKSYTAEINRKLAIALEVKPDVLAKAFEDSRRTFVINDPNAAQHGQLNVLRMVFANSGRKTWKTDEIVKLIDDIQGK